MPPRSMRRDGRRQRTSKWSPPSAGRGSNRQPLAALDAPRWMSPAHRQVVAAVGRARWAWMPCAASAVGRRQPRAEVGAPGGQPLAALGLHAASTSDSVEHSVYLGSRRALRPSASAGRCVPPALLQIPDTRGLRPAQLPRRQRPDHISRRGLGLACSAVRLLPWRRSGCAGRDIVAISP